MATPSVGVDGFESLLPSWQSSLAAEHKAPRTIQSYEEAVRQFLAFLAAAGMATAAAITREHVESFIVSLRDAGRSPATCANRYRSLQQLFRWLEEEGEVESSPMAKMRPPKIEEQPVDVFTDDELRRLFDAARAATSRRGATRDRAAADLHGRRVGEVPGLRVEDVDLDGKVACALSRAATTPSAPSRAQVSGYSSLRQARGSSGGGFGVRSSRK